MMRTLSKLSLTAFTVRYLKACQIGGQLRYRLIRPVERYPNGNDLFMTQYIGCAWPNNVSFLSPGPQNNHAYAICDGTLRFLNMEETVGFPPKWDNPELPRLWQYNLHYFEWLWSLNYSDAKYVVHDWIEKHTLSKAAVGWEPYPTSLRLMNWCAVFWGRFSDQINRDPAFLKKLWRSVLKQVQWLMRHLDIRLLGNHYFENGATLAFLGSCFKGEQARRWLENGYRILAEQIPEQVLPSGIHFELSPMYHCRIVYLLSMLMATGNDRLIKLVAEPLGWMLRALDVVCHPDSRIALLNDSAFGIYNEPDQLRSFCNGLLGVDTHMPPISEGCFALPDAGYYGWRDSDGNYLLCDFGKIGPDYIPGHAHADMFSYELSLDGRRVIVDSGVHNYEVSSMRRYNRSTKAHNTVEINGQDQCEMWRAFRVARRGYPNDVSCKTFEDGFQLIGWHDGYGRLPGKPVHHRLMKWTTSEGLIVYDKVTSSKTVKAVSRIHLHPDCAIVDCSDSSVLVACGQVQFRIVGFKCNQLKIEPGYYCHEFGRIRKNDVICLSGKGKDIELCYQLKRLRVTCRSVASLHPSISNNPTWKKKKL